MTIEVTKIPLVVLQRAFNKLSDLRRKQPETVIRLSPHHALLLDKRVYEHNYAGEYGTGNVDFLVITAADKIVYLYTNATADKQVNLTVYRNPSVSAQGTEVVMPNMNDIEPVRVKTTQMFSGPTVTDTGEEFQKARPIGASGSADQYGSNEATLILRSGTSYLARYEITRNNTLLSASIAIAEVPTFESIH